jgi:hypothetical protein
MKKKIVLFFLILMFLPVFFLYAEDIVLGKIIELSEDKKIIQVGDYILKVGKVFIDSGEEEIIKSDKTVLTEGRLVRVSLGKREEDYWQTEQIIVFSGAKKKEVLKEIE